MPLRGELFGPGEALPPAWDQFVAQQRLLRAWESGAFAALSGAGQAPWVGLVQDGGEPVALVWGRLRGPWAPALFECKLPWVSQPGLAFATGLDQRGRRAAVLAFERALATRLRWRCACVAYRQITRDDLELVRGFGRARIATSYPGLVLPNSWPTMDDYYLSLPRKTRHRLRAQYRQIERDPSVEVRLCSKVPDSAETSRLIGLTNLRYPRPPLHTCPPAAYFDALSGDGVLYLSYHGAAGKLLGVGMIFDTGEWLTDSLWGGLDPHDGGRAHIYFHRYLRLIGYMVERGRAGIKLGKGRTEIKQRYGAHGVPQFVVAGPR
jgi:hypothetical protein